MVKTHDELIGFANSIDTLSKRRMEKFVRALDIDSLTDEERTIAEVIVKVNHSSLFSEVFGNPVIKPLPERIVLQDEDDLIYNEFAIKYNIFM